MLGEERESAGQKNRQEEEDREAWSARRASVAGGREVRRARCVDVRCRKSSKAQTALIPG